MAEDLQFALERLADESRPVHMINLAPLSDLPRGQAELFRTAWSGFSPQRRLDLMRALVEQAESNIQLNFFVILREVLRDPDAEVRRLAIEGLWEDNRPNLISPLVTLTTEDPAPAVRAAAATSLGRFVLLGALGDIAAEPAERAEEALRGAWHRQGEVTEVRRRALEGLAYIDAADVRELIHMAYYDEDQLLRQSAVFAMGRSADRRWGRFVLAELESREVAMRFEAAVAAGELALPAAVSHLIRLLDDADSTVREAAATALGQIGGPTARRALRAAANSDDEILADAANTALDELSFGSGHLTDPLFDFGTGSASDGLGEDGDEDDDEDDGNDPFPADFAEGFAQDFSETEGGELEDAYTDDEVYDYAEDDVDWLDEDDDEADEDDGPVATDAEDEDW